MRLKTNVKNFKQILNTKFRTNEMFWSLKNRNLLNSVLSQVLLKLVQYFY